MQIKSVLLAKIKSSKFLKGFIKSILKVFPVYKRVEWIRNNTYPFSEIEKKYGFVFVHIPKTAGKGVVYSLFGEDFLGHNYASNYKKREPDFFEKSFSFAFVRNPWDRLVSAYHYLYSRKAGPVGNEFAEKFINQATFKEFVADFSRRKDLYTQWTHFIPQSRFVKDANGDVIVDFIGRFENLASDYQIIRDRMGIKGADLVVKNRSIHAEYWSYYDYTSAMLVADIYKEDIDLFGYQFPFEKLNEQGMLS